MNTNDRGGAATAIIRIHMALLSLNVDSHILFLNNTGKQIPNSQYFKNPKPGILQRIIGKIRRTVQTSAQKIRDSHEDIEWFTDPCTPFDISTHPLIQSADLVQLNWVSGFVDEPSFFRNVEVPIVWRMPDLYACGGGYHYEKDFPFERLKKRLARNSGIRKAALANGSVHFVAISNWVRDRAQHSNIIGDRPIHVIHNGLDFSTIPAIDRNQAKREFGFSPDKTIVLLGADRVHVRRKGLKQAIEAVEMLNDPKVQLVVFGTYRGENVPGALQMGHLDSGELFRLYTAAHIFLMPSLEEAFGQVFIEALACGTPVVSFPNGGAMDIIIPNKNGVMARSFESTDLAEALKVALDTNFDHQWISRDARQRFDGLEKAKAYIKLYEELKT